MFISDRRVLFVGTTAAMPPGLLLCALLFWPDLCADAWRVSFVKGAFPEEQCREEKLDRYRHTLQWRSDVKTALVHDVAEGRLTLLEAGARTRELDRATPEFPWDAFRLGTPGLTDEERHCREVISHLRGSATLGPTRSDELAQRLEEELRQLIERGTLQLPELPPRDTVKAIAAP
jgi:hypothetical protein